jgi:hypothetical protein
MNKKNKNTNYDDKTIASFSSSINTSNKDKNSIKDDITINTKDILNYTFKDTDNNVKVNNDDKNSKNTYYDDESIASFGSSINLSNNNNNNNNDDTLSVHTNDITVNSEDKFSYKSIITEKTIEETPKCNTDDNIKVNNDDKNSKNTVKTRDDNSKNKDSKTLISNLTNHSYMLHDDYLSNKGDDDVFSYVSNVTSDNKTPKHFVTSYKSLYKELYNNPTKPFPYDVPNDNNILKEAINKNPNNEQSNVLKPIIFNHEVTEPSYNADKTYKINKKKVIIDVAVLCQEYTNVETICDDNIVNLDEICITKEMFQAIFYPYKDNFGINKDFMINHKELLSLVSFLPEHRSINNNKKKFYLLEELIANIERNLNISRNCFTKDSLVELTNEIIGIKTLLDINCCSVLSSLSWPNVLEVIENYKLVNHTNESIVPVCVVNIVFKTPTTDVKNTTIRFNYKITNYC